MANTVQGLVYRLVQGTPLSDQQGDNNLAVLSNFSNSIAAAISVSLNPNGTLTAGSVNNINQIAPQIPDGIIANLTLPTAVFTSATNTYAITNPNITTLKPGSRLQFIPDSSCLSGNLSISLNGGPPILVVVRDGSTIANIINSGSIAEVIYDGNQFQLMQIASIAGTIVPGAVVLAQATDLKLGTDQSKAVTPYALANAVFTAQGGAFLNANGTVYNVPHGLPSTPSMVRFVLLCTNVSGDNGYAHNTEIDVYDYTGTSDIPCFVTSANATSVNLDFTTSGTTYPRICPYGGGARGAMNPSNWTVKVYASVF